MWWPFLKAARRNTPPRISDRQPRAYTWTRRIPGGIICARARRRTILYQFFSESLVIMLSGGFIGFFLASVVLRIVKSLPAEQVAVFVGIPRMSPLVAVSTVLILLTIGAVAGFIPARNAASTNPIVALRK